MYETTPGKGGSAVVVVRCDMGGLEYIAGHNGRCDIKWSWYVALQHLVRCNVIEAAMQHARDYHVAMQYLVRCNRTRGAMRDGLGDCDAVRYVDMFMPSNCRANRTQKPITIS